MAARSRNGWHRFPEKTVSTVLTVLMVPMEKTVRMAQTESPHMSLPLKTDIAARSRNGLLHLSEKMVKMVSRLMKLPATTDIVVPSRSGLRRLWVKMAVMANPHMKLLAQTDMQEQNPSGFLLL